MDDWERIPSFNQSPNREEYEIALDLIYNSIFEKIERQMTALIEQLKENIDAGKYDTILSDELSGRIVALVIKKIMSKVSLEGKSADVLFVAGGKNSYEIGLQSVGDAIKRKVEDSKGVLVATDFIANGRTAKLFIESVGKARPDLMEDEMVDVATHGSYVSGIDNLTKEYPQVRFFNGGSQDLSESLSIGKTGLEFSSGSSPYPEKTEQLGTEFTNEERIAKIRLKVEELAEKIYQEVWNKNEKTTN